MLSVNNVGVYNIHNALHGMRNPLESWDKSDSICTVYQKNGGLCYGVPLHKVGSNDIVVDIKVGEEDKALALKLIKAGSDHSKFMRQIFVSIDITAPDYWWKEKDTYKVATVANSTSTMHKLGSRHLTPDDFSWDDEEGVITIGTDRFLFLKDYNEGITIFRSLSSQIKQAKENNASQEVIADLEKRTKKVWKRLIQDLPMSFNYMRTWTGNYQTLRNEYFARKNHKQSEWRKLCQIFETLPYSEFITAK